MRGIVALPMDGVQSEADREVREWLADGNNITTDFITSFYFDAGTTSVELNGLEQIIGVNYTEELYDTKYKVIRFAVAPKATSEMIDKINVVYKKSRVQ